VKSRLATPHQPSFGGVRITAINFRRSAGYVVMIRAPLPDGAAGIIVALAEELF
jgi:hypothetical protein